MYILATYFIIIESAHSILKREWKNDCDVKTTYFFRNSIYINIELDSLATIQ